MWPKREGPPVSSGFQKDHMETSLRRLSVRQICMPHDWTESRPKRSWENGILNSAVQPSESICVLTAQTGSHEGSANSVACPASCFTPEGLTVKTVLPMWLWK